MPFDYYRRLGRGDRATYRASDQVIAVEVPQPEAVRELLPAIESALAADDRSALGRATAALVHELCARLGASKLIVRVLAKRPSDASGELHGLYEREPDKPAILRVWMRTAAVRRPVAYRTFVRTVLHELCHHLDFEVLGLRDTFHTEGFFRRESSITRQLLGPGRPRRVRAADPVAPAIVETAQLDLFGSSDHQRPSA